MTRLLEQYKTDFVPQLMDEFGYGNRMAVPRLVKISVNMGVGSARDEPKALEGALADMALIAGQRGVATKARKSVSNFKLRRGFDVGCRVTLRGKRMYEFFDRLVNVAMPRIRDFRGVSPRGFDGRGNYNMGLSEQIVFPEINPDKAERTQGMHINLVTSAKTDKEGQALLRRLGMPFSDS